MRVNCQKWEQTPIYLYRWHQVPENKNIRINSLLILDDLQLTY